jgi:methionyl-tRNA formyltransferase
MKRLRIVFCGTPQFAVPPLKFLLQQTDVELAGVFTQPDRPRGRGQEVSFSAVKEAALSRNLPVFQPAKIRAPEAEEQVRSLAPDAVVIVAYGQIIPGRLLTIPRLGWINLHASLLPKYRGAAPANWAIAKGESVTGNTTMRIDAGMDTGDMLLQQELTISPDETAPELAARLSQAGAGLLAESLRGLNEGRITPRKQDHEAASLAPRLKREDGEIDWTRGAQEIYNRMRGFTPWPGAYTEFRGQTCHLLGRPVPGETSNEEPGTLLALRTALRVVCGAATILELIHVKVEGRKQISAMEFARGARLHIGERFGKP